MEILTSIRMKPYFGWLLLQLTALNWEVLDCVPTKSVGTARTDGVYFIYNNNLTRHIEQRMSRSSFTPRSGA